MINDITYDAKINVERVRQRVSNGGHDVPPVKVVSRYKRALALMPQLFNVCDELYVYDNSTDRNKGTPEPIIRYKYGQLEALQNSIWSAEKISQLINGTFINNFEP